MEGYGSSRIAGIGAFLPKQRVSTDDLMHEVNCRRFGIPENYISRHIGIIEKRVSDASMQPSDLAVLASEIALRDAGVKPDDIDLIIYTGVSRDYIEPATAHNVQKQLGVAKAFCLDVSNACLGFMTGLTIADRYIAGKMATRVLVCTGEQHRDLIHDFVSTLKKLEDKKVFKNKLGMLTVGDAGAAMVVEAKPNLQEGFQWFDYISVGAHHQLCYLAWANTGIVGEMIMQKVSQESLKLHWEMIAKTYDKLQWEPSMVDKLFAHQVGRRPYEEVLNLTSVPTEKAPVTYDNYGNLASATIPVGMYLYPPKKGERVLFIGAGSGIAICQWGMVF